MDSLEKVLIDIREWCDGNGYDLIEEVEINSFGVVRFCIDGKDARLGLHDFYLTKRLMAVCDDNPTKCFYRLPQSKNTSYKKVLDVFVSEHADDCVILDCRDSKEAKKIQRQLEAQYKLIDIIQKTQSEIDPDWETDWDNYEQDKCFLCLDFDEFYTPKEEILSYSSANYYGKFLPEKMYSSGKVMDHILTKNLISYDLYHQWQTGG